MRQEKKRLAQEALAKGTVPAMIFASSAAQETKQTSLTVQTAEHH